MWRLVCLVVETAGALPAYLERVLPAQPVRPVAVGRLRWRGISLERDHGREGLGRRHSEWRLLVALSCVAALHDSRHRDIGICCLRASQKQLACTCFTGCMHHTFVGDPRGTRACE
jgi:hypothetical protein